MTYFSDNPYDALDDELRRVPLPPGLIARLRRIARADDEDLDAALRAVPLPERLLPRLREIVVCSDGYIDQRLSDAVVPAGLLERLSAIPLYGDAEVDAQLTNVPVPTALLEKLSEIPESERTQVFRRPRRWTSSWWQVAAAAALVFMISSSYLLAIVGFVSTAYYREAEPAWLLSVDQKPLRLQMRNEVAVELAEVVEIAPPTDVADSVPQAVVAWGGDERFFVTSDMLARGPVDDLMQWLGASADPQQLGDPTLSTIAPLASAATHAVRPPRMVTEIATRGVTPHWTDHQALLFQYRYGVHPFLKPATAASTRFSRVPLITSTDSYEYAWDQLVAAEAGAIKEPELRKALAEKVRIEEFIQAQDYAETPPAAGTLGIRAHGGPSPFGGDGSRLLQVVVQAGDVPGQRTRPTHMTVLVDPDTRGRRALTLSSVQRALHQLVDQLAEHDTVALVTAGEEAHLLIEASGPQRADALHRAIEMLQNQDTFNVAEGLRLAATIADSSDSTTANESHLLVILTDGLGEVASATQGRIERLIGDLAGSGVALSIVDLGSGRLEHASLRGFAAAGSGQVIAAREDQELDWALEESLRGQSNVIAEDATLTVRFNPDAVAEYRLIGHEATSVLGVVESPLATRLRAGQAAVGMFELRLHERGPNVVGWAELSWLDPRTGRSHHLRQPISRLQFAGTFAEAAMSLQAALIATEAAELLRESPFAGRPASSFAQLRRLARQVDRPMRVRPEFQRLLRFLDRAASMGIR